MARAGFPVCSHHGAGCRKKERAGLAKNPAFTRLTTGARAKPATFEQLRQERPELRLLLEADIQGDDVWDVRRVIALAKQITASLVSHADSHLGADPQAAFIAVGALSHLLRAMKNMLDIEEQLGPITDVHMSRIITAIMTTINQYVPKERRAEAIACLQLEGMGRDESGPLLTPAEVYCWTSEMHQAYDAGVPVNLIRLMAKRPGQPQYSALAELVVTPAAPPRSALEILPSAQPQAIETPAAPETQGDFLEVRPVLLQARNIAEELARSVNINRDPNGSAGALIVLKMLEQVARATSDLLRVERRLGPLLHADLRRLMHAVSITMDKFVPENDRMYALEFLRRTLSAG
jgi:hypothetical protein